MKEMSELISPQNLQQTTKNFERKINRLNGFGQIKALN